MRVRDLMTPDPKTLGRNDELRLADELMSMKRIRHLPVLDEEGELVGVVSQRDLFRNALARAIGYGTHAQEQLLGILTVKEVMSDRPIVVAPDTPLESAARLMLDRKVGCLPVVEDGKLVGILTETDFVATYCGTER